MTSRGPTLAFSVAFVFFAGALVYWVLQQPGTRRDAPREAHTLTHPPDKPPTASGKGEEPANDSHVERLNPLVRPSDSPSPIGGEGRIEGAFRGTEVHGEAGRRPGEATVDRRGASNGTPAIRGEPIRPLSQATGSPVGSGAQGGRRPGEGAVHGQQALDAATRKARPVPEDGATLGWDILSGFKFEVHEVANETTPGRPLLTSDDTIPDDVKAWDGRRVKVEGFVLPLRTRQRQVTEFLLLRDQGTCCFGPRAQINHFIRVKYFQGFRFNAPVPYRATGRLRVGEIRVQGYLTGLYEMDADNVEAGEEE